MRGPSGTYTRRFTYWEFWIALAAVVFDVVAFAIPVFALAYLVVLMQPQGWRRMAWLTDMLRRIQDE